MSLHSVYQHWNIRKTDVEYAAVSVLTNRSILVMPNGSAGPQERGGVRMRGRSGNM